MYQVSKPVDQGLLRAGRPEFPLAALGQGQLRSPATCWSWEAGCCGDGRYVVGLRALDGERRPTIHPDSARARIDTSRHYPVWTESRLSACSDLWPGEVDRCGGLDVHKDKERIEAYVVDEEGTRSCSTLGWVGEDEGTLSWCPVGRGWRPVVAGWSLRPRQEPGREQAGVPAGFSARTGLRQSPGGSLASPPLPGHDCTPCRCRRSRRCRSYASAWRMERP